MFALTIDDETSVELLEEHHAEELFTAIDANRTYLRRWLPWLDASRRAEDTRAFIRMSLQAFAARNGFACGLRHESRLVGGLGLHKIDWPNRATSIGYWIAEGAQGRGIVTRACAVLLEHVFGELGLNRVEVACATGNRRSCAIPERLGFTREGIRRESEWLYDHYVDLVVYSMLAGEWRKRRTRADSP
ncbi:MAG: GNAT family N-acetyltransferase [Luteitalea sp.]|nr:GNAT family N-acetyltransferase [Luteitalea sp.]